MPVYKFICKYSHMHCHPHHAVVHSLLVTPPVVTKLEDSVVNFFCREDNNNFATDIVWQDPHENYYIPGSGENENIRISAVGSRLEITNIIRNDTGIYRCLRSSNHTEFADGELIVYGMQLHTL